MKKTLLIALLLLPYIFSYAQPAVNALKSAELMANAFVKGDYDTFSTYNHQMIVKNLGGKQKMITHLQKEMKKMADEGVTFKNVSVGEVSKIYKSGNELQCGIIQTLVMGVNGGTLTARSSLLGFSTDSGKSWTFANVGNNTAAQLKAMFPNYNQQLVLEKPSEPVFKSEN